MKNTLPAISHFRANAASCKVLRRLVKLAFRDSRRLQARTLDVSPGGLTLISPLQIAKGQICDIQFDVPLDGKFRLVNAVSRSLDCVCVGTQGFRTSLRFIEIDASSRQVLHELMQYGA